MVARSLVFITALVVGGECAFGKKKEKFDIEEDEVPLTDARDYELENMARHKAKVRRLGLPTTGGCCSKSNSASEEAD